MMPASRNHAGFWAALGHRLSGLLLALFLPFHFLALGLAIEGEDKLESFLQWSDQPVVKFGEPRHSFQRCVVALPPSRRSLARRQSDEIHQSSLGLSTPLFAKQGRPVE